MKSLLLSFFIPFLACNLPVFAEDKNEDVPDTTLLKNMEWDHSPQNMDPRVKPALFDRKYFRPDPNYAEQSYDAGSQWTIYGGKRKVGEPFYPLIFGSRLYGDGEVAEGINLFGSQNLVHPRLMMFGDWRLVGVEVDDAKDQKAQFVTQLNIETDLQITATEHIHALFRPLDNNGQFTRYTIGDAKNERFQKQLDGNVDTLFFEGDIGAIWSGISGSYTGWDLPVAVGLMPLIFQNGVWVNDVLQGAAFTIPAKNNRWLGLSNFDATFFAGLKDVNSAAQDATKNDEVKIFGMNTFSEIFKGYLELGYGFTADKSASKQDYHSVAASFTHRWGAKASMSHRVIYNFGQKDSPLNNKKTANGVLLLWENSFMTRSPYTLIPYLNIFGGFDKPQGLAKQNGLLENTGISFEKDALTNFPFLENSANDTYGGTAGLEYLFNLDRQIVVEASTVQVIGSKFDKRRKEQAPEYAGAIRYQHPLAKSLILRFDSIYDRREGAENIWGLRTELRWKF